VISSTALYNAAKHKGLRGLAHPIYMGLVLNLSSGKLRRMLLAKFAKTRS
jgi:hypothetical protein